MTQRSIMPVYGNNIKMEWKKNNDIPQNQFGYELTTLNMRPPGFVMETKLDTSLLENKIERKPNSNTYTLTANNKSKSLEFSVPIETFGLVAAINILQSVSTPKAITQKNTYPNRDGFTAIRSQPSDSLFRIMMHRSDNFYAEQILLMAGDELNKSLDEERTISTLLESELKYIPQKPRWVDGSGLSRYNLFSPKDMVYIIEKLINEFGVERVTNILPTGGAGTLKNMFLAEKGFIFAKTGSMGNTYCLSGLLKSAKGKTLLFSVMTNNFSGKTADVKKPIEQFLQYIRMNY
jgi:D-alanyl-D-alanine carboxypeptidase/D-alanyl-D-alanine-endopeptidase (penicillin-binding protein 4)